MEIIWLLLLVPFPIILLVFLISRGYFIRKYNNITSSKETNHTISPINSDGETKESLEGRFPVLFVVLVLLAALAIGFAIANYYGPTNTKPEDTMIMSRPATTEPPMAPPATPPLESAPAPVVPEQKKYHKRVPEKTK